MNDPYLDYWRECVAQAAEESQLTMTDDQLERVARAVKAGHDSYGDAFYSPPSTDCTDRIEAEWREKLSRMQAELDAYRANAETAMRKALGQYDDTPISIHEHGEVLRHGGRTERIQ